MHEVCRDLIAGFKARGWCDAIDEFARRYPIVVFCELFGLPEERREEFRLLAETWMHDVSRASDLPGRGSAPSCAANWRSGGARPATTCSSGIANGRIDGELVGLDRSDQPGLDRVPGRTRHPALEYRLDACATWPTTPRPPAQIIEDPSCLPGCGGGVLPALPVGDDEPQPGHPRHRFSRRATSRPAITIMSVIFLANCDSQVFDDPLTLDFERKATSTWPSPRAPTAAWAPTWPATSWPSGCRSGTPPSPITG